MLITGGTGTLGRQVVPRLRHAGYHVRVLSRPSHRGAEGGNKGGEGIELVPGDLATGEGIEAAVAGSAKGDEVKAAHLVGPRHRPGWSSSPAGPTGT
jgi:nucleoside-diphosphate-sugar epimerase